MSRHFGCPELCISGYAIDRSLIARRKHTGLVDPQRHHDPVHKPEQCSVTAAGDESHSWRQKRVGKERGQLAPLIQDDDMRAAIWNADAAIQAPFSSRDWNVSVGR